MSAPFASIVIHLLNTERPSALQVVELTEDVTWIGRPPDDLPGLRVDLQEPWVSRQHVCLERKTTDEGTVYHLLRVLGRDGVRLYERLLLRGDSFPLAHGYTVQLPGILDDTSAPFFCITYRADRQQTWSAALKVASPNWISVFGEVIELQPQEYDLIAYLYERRNTICPYLDILANLWNTAQLLTNENIATYRHLLSVDAAEYRNRKNSLDSCLSNLRARIADVSGGVTFIETVRGVGLCLRLPC